MSESLNGVPELSLASFTQGNFNERERFVNGLYEGLKQYGFIILTDHCVDTSLLEEAYSLAETFFALPEKEKEKYNSGDGGQRGYTAFGREHAKGRDIPDLKEFWHVGRECIPDSEQKNIYKPNVWPHSPQNFRKIFLKLYDGLEQAGQIMLDALAPSLGVSAEYFRELMYDGNSILRLLHYPPIPGDCPEGAVRAAAHEDINLITLLVSANGSGLQLLRRDGTWLDIETAPENLIVDAGDMLARITNDIIPATTHRVINPEGPNVSRYSMPFFMHPNPSAILSCLESCQGNGVKYEDITANDFLLQRLREIGLTQKTD